MWDYIHLNSDDKTRRLNLNALHEDVRTWFDRRELETILGEPSGATEEIALDWMARAGKRWRPFLTVAAFQALRDDRGEPIPDDIKKIAVAVECFHKASLIHDDIEDEDHERYGESTLHHEHGVPVALNVGDLLIGEGYRLIGECNVSDAQKTEMILAASVGQRELCRGQGAELLWARNPDVLKSTQVLEIFRQKTAPAFEVALQVGAAYAGHLGTVKSVLHEYSEALGIAYQIRDDLDDHSEDSGKNKLGTIRPSILLSTTFEKAKGDDKEFMKELWSGSNASASLDRVRDLAHHLQADDRCMLLLESYKEIAIRSLQNLENANLKGLLRRVLGKIFNDLEIKGWCREYEVKNGVREENEESAPIPQSTKHEPAVVAG